MIEASSVFEHLKTLAGTWSGKTESGRPLGVTYRLIANGSALIELWTLAPDAAALTIYHMDNRRLVATHYCPIGNQPRLHLREPNGPSSYIFDFESATNLSKPGDAHQTSFEVRLIDANSFWRSETYAEGTVTNTEAALYTRSDTGSYLQ